MTLLSGMHDREGRHVVPSGGWALDLVALSESPQPTDYTALKSDINWITRLSWGYGSTGTIPLPARYAEFAQACAQYVAQSRGCTRWIVGNESNHSQERPDGQAITPESYAACFHLCRQAIKQAQPQAEVIPAPVALWNVETGDWLTYWRNILDEIRFDGGCDALAIHSYIRAADPALVDSDEKMQPPYQDRYAQFNAYRDTLERVPANMRDLPIYLTEANPLDGWQARGIMPAMLDNVHGWNATPGTQKIQCVCFYRFPDYDQWGMASKRDVIAEFEAHATRHPSPTVEIAGPGPDEPDIFVPTVTTGGKPMPDLPAREIGGDFRARVPEIKLSDGTGDKPHYRLIRAEYVPNAARRFGPDHHILVDVLDADGARVLGVPVNIWWGTGAAIKTTNKPNGPYALDYAMHNAGHSFGVKVADDDATSDSVFGLGLGKIGSEHIADHVGYYLVFREAKPQAQNPPAPVVPRPQPGKVPKLTHPVANPAHRRVTQVFGVNPERYAQFGLDGHNGVDFAVPVGQPIRAAARGTVVEARNDEAGYGKYIKLRHPWGETLYAHLSVLLVAVGMAVDAGQVIAQSGNTGNSTGPHLHFGLRVNPYERGRPFDGYSDPLPYLADEGESPVEPPPLEPARVVHTIREAAREFGADEELLLSLAWAESSYRPHAVSGRGAQGLFQIMPPTWDEWAPKVGANDPFDAKDNARVAARYYLWLRAQVADDGAALAAFNWGIGNVLAGREAPPETRIYIRSVLHGRDLLRAVTQ